MTGKHSTIDYLIVGQGLAGSAVAIQLIKAQKKIVVMDRYFANSSSRVAAGLYNPVTGKRMVKTWMADKIFPYLHQYYPEVEALTGTHFFNPMPLYRPFLTIEEQNEWMGRSSDPAYQNIIKDIYTRPFMDHVRNPYGGVLISQSGYVDTTRYLEAVKALLQRENSWLQGEFAEGKLTVADNHVVYDGIRAEKIIFCEGSAVSTNRWFSKLPIGSLKGETLSINCDWREHVILNRSVYIVPGNGAGQWKVGATYNVSDKTPGVTEKGRTELEEKLDDLLGVPYEVFDQQWGIRPTTTDHRPILGNHPELKPLVIFNGLGTKGVSLAPYFSEILVHWLENGGTIGEEVNITRYKLLY